MPILSVLITKLSIYIYLYNIKISGPTINFEGTSFISKKVRYTNLQLEEMTTRGSQGAPSVASPQ